MTDTNTERLNTAAIAGANEQQTVDHTPVQPRTADRAERPALFDEQAGQGFHTRWTDIQASFVDEPRKAVEQADELVAEVMQRLAQQFAQERSTLEQQWDRGGETDTEELRQALRRYRSFFDRLLSF
jgi:hypothetical protein